MGENKTIVTNTLILFLRLIITTIIGIFATRLVLSELGIKDYGLYSIVGGIVIIMNYINTSMLSTTFRFIAYEIGKGDGGEPNKVFNISLVIHLSLSVLLILLSETIGKFYVVNYLNIDIVKIPDALYVLRFSVFTTVLSIISIPYQAVITAQEKFLVRATIETLRAILNLIAVFLLMDYIGNKLRLYSSLMFFVMIIPMLLFITYNYFQNYKIIKIKFYRKPSDYIEILRFSGWIMIGTVAYIGVRQGAAVIINLFFGTILNAAFGIATQVNNYVMMFVKNLNQAAIPQITKNHGGGNIERSLDLVYYISKYSYFLMLLGAVPILLSLKEILFFWLKEVPEYTVEFTALLIVNGLIGVTSSGFDAMIQATGKIKQTQLWYSAIMIITLPISFILFKYGAHPYTITIITILATLLNRSIQIKILSKLTAFNKLTYWKITMLPIISVSLIVIPQYWLRKLFSYDIQNIILFSLVSFILTSATIYLIGLTRNEKYLIKNNLIRRIKI